MGNPIAILRAENINGEEFEISYTDIKAGFSAKKVFTNAKLFIFDFETGKYKAVCDYCDEKIADGYVKAYKSNVCLDCFVDHHGETNL